MLYHIYLIGKTFLVTPLFLTLLKTAVISHKTKIDIVRKLSRSLFP